VFKPGDDPRRGKGGKRQGSGRKSKDKKEIERKAEEIARAYIENNIKPVIDTYGKVAKGYMVEKVMTTKSGNVIKWEEFVYDSQILKHYMDRVIPARAPEDKQGHALSAYYIHPPLESEE